MQAARGASLNSSADVHPTSRGSHARLIFGTVFLLGYTVDVVSKIVAVERLSGRADIQVVGDLLQLRLTRNPGAAFSTATELTPVLTVLAIVACGVVLYVARRLGSVAWAVGLGFLLAGIAGNLTDRLFREPGVLHGHVIDFLMLPNWPIFNVADICINVGAVLALVTTFRGVAVDGSRVSDDAPTQDAEG